MIVTEKEAKEKFCPRGHKLDTTDLSCLGSHCMAWAWRHKIRGEDQRGFCGMVSEPGPEDVPA